MNPIPQSDKAGLGDFLQRKEVVAFVVALIVAALGKVALASGLPVPEGEITKVTIIGIGVFVAAVLEGSYKPDYGAGWKTLLSSTKFRALGASLIAVVGNAFLPAQYQLDDATVSQILNFLLGLVAVKGGVDAFRASGG